MEKEKLQGLKEKLSEKMKGKDSKKEWEGDLSTLLGEYEMQCEKIKSLEERIKSQDEALKEYQKNYIKKPEEE